MTSTFKKPKHYSDNKGITLVGDIYQVTAADVNNPVRVNYNEVLERTARHNMDDKEKSMKVSWYKAITEAFSTTTGNVIIVVAHSIWLLGRKLGAMHIPLNLNPTGHSLSFGAEKPSGEKRPDYTDVFVHINWTTKVIN